MAQIERELRDLPTQARADEMREIESHLRAMIEARGDVAGVMAQFGKPRKVGRDLRRAWERKQPESWINSALAFVIVCLFVSGHNYFWFNFLDGFLLFFRPTFYYFFVEGFGSQIRSFCIYFFIEGLCTLIVGTAIGFIASKRGHIIIVFVFPFLILLDFFPMISVGLGLHNLSFFTVMKYAILLFLLIIGKQFGARFSQKRHARFANAQ